MPGEWLLLLPTGAGVAMGLLYALSGFHGGAKTTEFKRNPRVTNLIWVAAGGFAALLGGWEKLQSDPKISNFTMAGAYTAAAFGTAIFAIAVIAVSVYRDRKRQLLQAGRAGRRSETEMALLYVHSGYPAYEEALKAEREQTESIVRSPETRRITLQRCADLAGAIGSQIAASSAINESAATNLRDLTVDSLLGQMMSVVIQQTAMSKDDLAINFMVAMPFAEAIKQHAKVTRFIFDPHDRYETLLLLKRYLGRGGGDDFGLPVHAQGPNVRPLPGAPSVIFNGNARYVQTDRFNKEYAKGLTPTQRRQIFEYLDGEGICCFLSLPIQWGGKRLGVVNVDSKRNRFGLEDNPAGDFANTLLPFCMLLGNVVRGG